MKEIVLDASVYRYACMSNNTNLKLILNLAKWLF